MKKLLLALLTACAIPFMSSAQDMHAYGNSNYGGITSASLNPAMLADSRYKVDILLFGMNTAFSNNYLGFSKTALAHPDYSFFGAIKADGDTDRTTHGFPAFNDSLFADKYLSQRHDGQIKSFYFKNRIQLPSALITINERNAIGIVGAIRTYVNVDGIEEPLADQVYADFGDSVQYFAQLHNKHFSVQYMSWQESGITWAFVAKQEGEHFLKFGVTPKLLLGLGSAYMYVNDLEYMTTSDSTLTFFKSDVQYSHSNNFEFPQGGGFKYKISSKVGVGLDLGMVYEWRPDYQKYKYDMDGETNLWMRSKNKYKLRVGFSITDIGAIKFERGQYSNNFNADVTNWNIRDLNFDSIPIRAFDDTLRARFLSNPTDKFYKMNLPTAFSMQVDYQIWKDFYVNFTPFVAIQWSKNANKVHEVSNFSLTPRWDHRWFGVMVPFSYNQYRNFNVGACARIGPLILGTDNLAAFFSKSKTVYGADFYLEAKIPIFYKEPKDKDKDKVSNKKDHCIDVPGVWEFLGCPDRDGDHVQDSEDLCPDVPGLKQYNGCPDRDGDGIIDSQDACPDDPGLAAFNGCPDKDGDGIIDKDDDCPDEPGLPVFKGCPDKDGDGVMDKIDLCPEKPGPVENEGCPEIKLSLVDLAGQALKISKQAKDGSFTFESLPSDSICVFRLEGDPDKTIGVNEVKVIVNGTAKRAIRSQADGLFRFDIPKPVGNGLKPMEVKDVVVVLTKEEQAVIKKAFDNLEFESGKDIIRSTSFQALDELAALLVKHPDWALKISGHTDNVGKPAANMTLSKKRAESVKRYLVSKGVNATHLKTEYFGQTRPIAPNTTPEGRQKNRRVEMLIIDFATMGPAEQAAPTPAKTPAKKPPVKK
jgi:outer membrane protein OmpA-like peptidoglycan-associated protein